MTLGSQPLYLRVRSSQDESDLPELGGDREVSTVGPLVCFPASSSTSHFRPPRWVEDAFVFFIHRSIFQLPLLKPEDPSRLIPTYVLGSLCLHFCCVTVCLYDKHLHTLAKGIDYINTKQKTQDRISVLMAPLTPFYFLLTLLRKPGHSPGTERREAALFGVHYEPSL